LQMGKPLALETLALPHPGLMQMSVSLGLELAYQSIHWIA